MAYQLSYWESAKTPDTHYELKCIRLKSINEIMPLALPHNRPKGTSLITVNRTDSRSTWEKIVWDKDWEPNHTPDLRLRKSKGYNRK